MPKFYWDDPYYEIDRVVHQDDFSKIPDSVTMPDPWLIVKSGDVLEIENRNIQQGHVILESADYVLNFTQTYLSELNLSFFPELGVLKLQTLYIFQEKKTPAYALHHLCTLTCQIIMQQILSFWGEKHLHNLIKTYTFINF